MPNSDSLATAHENLLRVIPEEAEQDVDSVALHDAARRFVDACSTEPAAMAELTRRGTLCAKLIGEGSEYFTAKVSAWNALSWNAVSMPNNFSLQRLINSFQSEGGRELVVEVRDEYGRLRQLLDGSWVLDASRPLLEAWCDAAWSIASQGENESWDGCWWLLHTDNLQFAPSVHAAAPAIRQAAKALVRWCDGQKPTPSADPKERKKTWPTTEPTEGSKYYGEGKGPLPRMDEPPAEIGEIEVWLNQDRKTLNKNNEQSYYCIVQEPRGFRVWFSSQPRFAAANKLRLSMPSGSERE